MTESGARYPFIIMNKDKSDRNGIYWWSFFNLRSRKETFLFDSFVFEVFKEFILQNDQKLLNKTLYGIKRFNKEDNKIILRTLKFSMREYDKIKNKNRLSENTVYLLHLMNKFEKKT